MRLKAKVDVNQKRIVDALRKAGYSVLHLHTLGKGAPDILVGGSGSNILFEIKDGTKTASQKKLTPDEVQFHQTWKGQVTIIENIEQAIEYLKTKTK
jgi:Holliday junction resolvase